MADTVATLLTLHGFQVTTVYSGTDLLTAVSKFTPDAAVCGLDLPGVNGYDVARQLRAAGHRLILIAQTGHGHPNQVTAVRAAGFDHHLLKPAQPDELVRLLRPPADEGDGSA